MPHYLEMSARPFGSMASAGTAKYQLDRYDVKNALSSPSVSWCHKAPGHHPTFRCILKIKIYTYIKRKHHLVDNTWGIVSQFGSVPFRKISLPMWVMILCGTERNISFHQLLTRVTVCWRRVDGGPPAPAIVER